MDTMSPVSLLLNIVWIVFGGVAVPAVCASRSAVFASISLRYLSQSALNSVMCANAARNASGIGSVPGVARSPR